ncbi:MAG: hypothetical protein L3J33_11660 [Rhodobacteraceae bacterium]|nr:hypothetical protein [Paracoccaceae bacterium]
MMVGWIERRQRKEHIKLVTQNYLVETYLLDFFSNALETGDSQALEMCLVINEEIALVEQLQKRLKAKYLLMPDVVSQQLNMQKQLRKIYDGIFRARKQFAAQFGGASEPLLPFDKKFVPNEGWKIFISHFGVPG